MGRKLAIAVSLVLTIISFLLILISDSIYLKGIGLFVWGGGSEISYSILMSFITEKTAEHSRTNNYVTMQFWFIMGCLLNCVTFYLFKDWKLVLACYFLVLYIIATILFIYYVESTPIDLISRYSSEEAFNSLIRIAKINEVGDHGITLA
jgi:MFS family permease